MRFETSQSTPPHLNRRLQMRMLSIIGMLALCLFVWNTLFEDPPPTPHPMIGRPTDLKDEINLDGDGSGGDRSLLGDDEFILGDADFGPPPDLLKIAPRSRAEQAAAGDGSTVLESPRDRDASQRKTQFDKRLLSKIRDNTIGIRNDEAEAYFRLLHHVRSLSLHDLERVATTEVQYVNVMTEPDRFRGELVTIQGSLRRLYQFEATPNDYGISTLYEAWIFTGDSGNHPYRVVSTSIPQTLIPGTNTPLPVRVTGFFFKREGYRSGGGMHVAPTLLTPVVTPFRPSNAIPPADGIVSTMIRIVTSVGLALLVTLLAFIMGDRRKKREARQIALNEPRPLFANVEIRPPATIQETLQIFAEQQRQDSLRQAIDATGLDAGTVATSILYRRDPLASVPTKKAGLPAMQDSHPTQTRSQARALKSWTLPPTTVKTTASHISQTEVQQECEQTEATQVLKDQDSRSTTKGDGDVNATITTAQSSDSEIGDSPALTSHSVAAGSENVTELEISRGAAEEGEVPQIARHRPSPTTESSKNRSPLQDREDLI